MKIILSILALSLIVPQIALAAGSTSYAPAVTEDVKLYNRGVELMLDKQFAEAENYFRRALNRNENFAEAHNNLAYTLRKQGAKHYDEALRHYNRAIEINSDLSEPYMYRGVLYVQMGETDMARKDHERLATMNKKLAAELEYVITHSREKEPERFFGVSRKKNG
jgi:tetratricopeptide (TPR) repeat protein